MIPNTPIPTQLTTDTISTEAFFSLQRGISGLGGFHGTHCVRSEVDHTVVSYLPDFAIALPPDECSEPVCASLLETTLRKNEAERRLGFCPALQRWRRQRCPDLRRRWKPPSHALHHAPSQAISRVAALPRTVLFRHGKFFPWTFLLRRQQALPQFLQGLPPLSCSRSMPPFVFLPNRSSIS
jgi:hypothetical protein